MGYLASNSNTIMTSVGHKMSSAAWIDAHYQACAFEYEMMIRSVGFQRGWRVLDAGCGTGGFLPIMAELVGEDGEIAAVDIAPEHIEIVGQKAGAGEFACPITAHVADLKGLPFADKTFDAVWSANVFQYLNESELRAVLAEFRRVLKPGGVLAVKDGDISALQVFPVPSIVLCDC